MCNWNTDPRSSDFSLDTGSSPDPCAFDTLLSPPGKPVFLYQWGSRLATPNGSGSPSRPCRVEGISDTMPLEPAAVTVPSPPESKENLKEIRHTISAARRATSVEAMIQTRPILTDLQKPATRTI
jgi:hypothetical protein